ncbi:RNHCP domain-containing protein, partial [Patescibacteria group bacterium]|nr:RNHCP domain-containing protein [Patescibacteria group bacterium]
LWSMHVDVFPGDRSESCGGLMEPVGLKIKGGKEVIVHKCERCGEVRLCKVSVEDDRDEILKLSQLPLP